MSNGTESARCLNCGQPLGGLAPAGVCPRCLLLTGFDETTGVPELGPAGSHEPAASQPFPPRRFGDYELMEEIARGGMGIVYKARQVSLGRLVALKMLLFGQYSSQEFIHRFRIEASAAASLQHPNIVAIHEVGVYQDQHYFAMDLVDGPDLEHLVRDKPLSARTASRYTKAMAEAIQFAHQRRILHRDLKPSNVLIDSNDQPRITDFGLAKILTADSDLTVTGQVLGSPNYMPPEQASAERGRMGPASDVYSLGAILYHALTGRAPFVGHTLADTLQQVLHKEPIPARLLTPGIPADLETICAKCLEKEPSRRYATAQELADELGRFLRDEPIHARPITRNERVRRWCRRNPALSASLGFALVLLLVLGIGSPIALLRIRRAQATAEEGLYAANVNKGFQAAEASDISSVRQRLQWINESARQRAMRGWEWRYLTERAFGDVLAFLGRHPSWLADLAVSPDQLRLATISEDGVVALWDLAAQKELVRTNAHVSVLKHQPDSSHHAVVFTPDGAMLITAGEDGAVRFWDSKAPLRLVDSITNLAPVVNRLAISSSGKWLAGQASSRCIYLWALSEAAPRLVKKLETREVVPIGITFSPDDKTLLAGWGDRPIVQYDVSTPTSSRLVGPLRDLAAPFAFSPDGRWLVAAGFGRHRVRRVSWPSLIPLPDLKVQGGSIDGFAVSPDSRSLAAALSGGQLNCWGLTNTVPQAPLVFEGHEEPAVGVAFGRGAGRQELISISWDKSIRLWDPSGPTRTESIVRIGSPVMAVAISPDTRYLATVINNPLTNTDSKLPKPYMLQVREFKTHAEIASVAFGENGLGPRIVFSPDGTQIAVSEYFRLEFFKVPSLGNAPSAGDRGLAYATDGSWLAYISNGRIIKRASFNTLESAFSTDRDVFQDLALSPDGKTLASSTDYGAISLWDASTGRRRGPPLSGHTLRVVSLAFSMDSKALVSAGWDGHLGLWDAADGRNLALLRGHNNSINRAVICPDGGTIASCGDDDAVRLWNLDLRQEIAVLHGHTDIVNDLAFSHDGEWLASASNDGTVHLWHAPPADKFRTVPGTR